MTPEEAADIIAANVSMNGKIDKNFTLQIVTQVFNRGLEKGETQGETNAYTKMAEFIESKNRQAVNCKNSLSRL